MKMTIITTEKSVYDGLGKTVLLSFSYPQDESGGNLHRRIKAFYSHKEKQYEKRLADMADKLRDGELLLTSGCKILYQSGCFLSLRRDMAVKKNRRTKFVLSEFDTWELKTGLPLTLYFFEPDSKHIRQHIKSAAGDRKTFRKMLKNFSPDDFAVADGGTKIYIQNFGREIYIPFSRKSAFYKDMNAASAAKL